MSPPIEPTSGSEGALCLSGGGFRATMFHAGALRQLDERGVLASLDRVSSVSGGSIAAAILALSWTTAGPNLDTVERQIRRVAGTTLDWRAVVGGPLRLRSPARRLADLYDRHLFDGRTMQDLPDEPRFVFNTTNMVTGNLVRWSKPYVSDYGVGFVASPATRLADVVAASSAFPPFLSPMRFSDLGDFTDWETGGVVEPQPGSLWLTDGGVYDNLGLQTVERFKTVYISDGGAPFSNDVRIRFDWWSQSRRTVSLLTEQIRRRRLNELRLAQEHEGRRRIYWSIDQDDPLDTQQLSAMKTRLARMSRMRAGALAERGYECARVAIDS